MENSSDEGLADLHSLLDASDVKSRGLAARDGACPRRFLKEFARDPSPRLRWLVAQNPNTPEDSLRLLAHDVCFQIRECVASNRSCPPELRRSLREDEIADVRWAAEAPEDSERDERESSLSLCQALSNEERMRRARIFLGCLDRGHVIPLGYEFMGSLEQANGNESLRDNYWRNVSSADSGSLRDPMRNPADLAADYDGDDLDTDLLSNPAVPTWILSEAMDCLWQYGPHLEAFFVAARNANAPFKLSATLLGGNPNSGDPRPAWTTDAVSPIYEGLAMNLAAPAEWLCRLSDAFDPLIRKTVASNPMTPVSALLGLKSDSDTSVRAALARNPSVPYEVLTDLSTDSDREVRRSVTGNPLIESLTLSHLIGDEDPSVRLNAASHPLADSTMLLRYVKTATKEEVDALVLLRPSLPEDVIALLRDMGHRA